MPTKYKVYFAKYITVEVEAETDEEAKAKAIKAIPAYLTDSGWQIEDIEAEEPDE